MSFLAFVARACVQPTILMCLITEDDTSYSSSEHR